MTEAPIYESRAHMEGHPMEVTVSTVESNISIDDRKKGHRRSLAGYMPVVNYDYIPGKRIGPESLTYPTHEANDGLTCLQWRKYLLWSMLRMVSPTTHRIPSWTDFNIQMRAKVPVMQSNAGYLDAINNPAIDIATVYEMMRRVNSIKDRLHLQSIVCVVDQTMYAKACEVKFKRKEEFSDVVLFLGTFHTLMMILGVIGKRFDDAGFKDVIIRVIEEGSIAGVLTGKMHNRSIYAHKVLCEAIQRLLLKLFFTWLDEHGLSNEFGDETIQSIHYNLCPENFESSIDSEEFECYYTEYQRFVNYMKCENNPLATFWLSYIDLVSLVLDVIYSTRVGDCLLKVLEM